MGTRSLTFIYDGAIKPADCVCCMYRQYDGYPSGHGQELFKFLSSGTIVNGFGTSTDRLFNGMGCLAAQIVAEFKKGVGGFYLMPTKKADHGQEYEYHVYSLRDELFVHVKEGRLGVFDGPLERFGAFCAESEN